MTGISGRITYPLTIVLVVGATWCMAWARSINDESARGYWPAKDPELMRRVLHAAGPATDIDHGSRQDEPLSVAE